MLREHQLYCNFNKCDFYKDKIKYLRHVIFEEGISVDLDKIKAIINYLVSKDVTDVWSFMGIIGYYIKHIEGFSKIEKTITSL